MKTQDEPLTMAQQQFVGFGYAKQGGDIIGIVRAMGLTSNEWQELKKDYDINVDLSEDEIEEIEEVLGFTRSGAKDCVPSSD